MRMSRETRFATTKILVICLLMAFGLLWVSQATAMTEKEAAEFALSQTNWPATPELRAEVENGIRSIRDICPACTALIIGGALAIKYDMPWSQVVSNAREAQMPPEKLVILVLKLIHTSMVADLQKSGCPC